MGGEFDLAFQTVCGGSLVVEVSADVTGRTLTGKTDQVRIQGTNPTSEQVKAAISEPIVGRIIRLESGVRQFVSTATQENAQFPLFSQDNLLGAGLGQITPCTIPSIWSWRENVKAVNAKFADSRRVATALAGRYRTHERFVALSAKWNQARVAANLPQCEVKMPNLTADQITHEAVRCYNGVAGTDKLTRSHLHEYRIVMVDDENLDVQVDPSGRSASVSWEVVPAADRPQTHGDPDYVNHVYDEAEL